MNILIRHTLRSVGRNKLQTAIILATVILVSAILFISTSVTDIFRNIIINEYSRISIDADISIGGTGGETYSKAVIENLVKDDENIEYVQYFLRAPALLKTEETNFNVFVEATDLESFVNEANGFYLQNQIKRGAYPRAIISTKFAENYNVAIGDTVRILSPVSYRYITFQITHIMKADGFFGSSTLNNIVVNIDDVESLGLVNSTMIKLKDTSVYQDYVDTFQKALPYVSIGEAFPSEYLDLWTAQSTNLFVVAIVFIILIMLTILFTSFLIIAKNRMSEMAVFKAAGATPNDTRKVLLAEAVLYGLIGAFIGVLAGRVLVGILMQKFLPYAVGVITYNAWKYTAAFVLGALTSVIAAFVPIYNVSKMSIRQLTEKGEKHVRYAPIPVIATIGIIVLALLIAVLAVPSSYSYIIVAVAAPFLVVFLMLFVPYFLKWLSALFQKIFASGASRLAALSTRRNSSVNLVATLIAIVVAFSFLFVSVIQIVVVSVDPYLTRFAGDAVVTSLDPLDKDSMYALESDYEQLQYVDKAVAFQTYGYFVNKVGEEPVNSSTVYSLITPQHISDVTTGMEQTTAEAFVSTDKAIVLNYDLAQRLDVKVGDKLKLSYAVYSTNQTLRYNIDGEFSVVGLEYTRKDYLQVAFVKQSDLSVDEVPIINNPTLLITLKDGYAFDDVFGELDSYAADSSNGFVVSYDNWAFSSSTDISGLITLLRVLEGLFIAIAVIGVINIAIVTLLDREREFYLFRIYGMSFADYLRFSLAEGTLLSLSGSFTGLIVGVFLANLLPTLSTLVNKYLYFSVFPWQLPVVAICGVALFTAVWWMIALLSKKRFLKQEYTSFRL